MSADTTDRERLRLAATLALAFPSGWFIDFVEAREAAYQILTRLAEKGTPLTYDGSASGELPASPDDGANNASRETGSTPAPAADPPLGRRYIAGAGLTDSDTTLYERIAGKLLVRSGRFRAKRAARNDPHEIRHLYAAIKAGDSSGCEYRCTLDPTRYHQGDRTNRYQHPLVHPCCSRSARDFLDKFGEPR